MLLKERKIKFFNDVRLLNLDGLYNYDYVNYVNNRTKIKIKCRKHKIIFEQIPYEHLKLHVSCPYCLKRKKMNNETFIEKSIKIHFNEFDYSLVNYVNSKTKVDIICKEHGIFHQMPYLHLQNHGCPFCRIDYFYKFINNANIIHSNKYDYSTVDYINAINKVKIICPEHGIFLQSPMNHLRGFGCQICNESKGENLLSGILNSLKINFEKQKIFENCKDKRGLPFDFYLPEHNLCVEYDGRHHHYSIDIWGGQEKLEYIQRHDKIKNEYCDKNNIKLIRIKYNTNIKKIFEMFKSI